MNLQGNDAGEFRLHDLRVEVVLGEGRMVCNHRVGDTLEVRGEELHLPSGQSFSLYALAALLPLLPAKQRDTHANDWMTTDELVACPDPHCAARFRITRIGRRTFRHDEVSAVRTGREPDREHGEGDVGS